MNRIFVQNMGCTSLCLAVRLAEELHSWYETTKDKHRARAHLLWWLGCVAESGIEELKEAAKAIRWWFEYILNYYSENGYAALLRGSNETLYPRFSRRLTRRR